MEWKAKPVKHLGVHRIAVFFEKDAALIARIKQLEGAKWSQTKKYWHLPDTAENRIRFKIIAVENKIPNARIIEEIATFSQWLKSKRYSANTIKTYCEALKWFLFRNLPLPSVSIPWKTRSTKSRNRRGANSRLSATILKNRPL